MENCAAPHAHPAASNVIGYGPAALPRMPDPICAIALTDNPQVVETSLRHLGVLARSTPPTPLSHGLPGFTRVGREGHFGGRTGNWK